VDARNDRRLLDAGDPEPPPGLLSLLVAALLALWLALKQRAFRPFAPNDSRGAECR